MVIIKYIGKTTDFKGKTLWEILGNLKNFGVGRTVVRSRFVDRYPEKSFFKIMSVTTHPRGDEFDTRKVEVIAEKTFRGKAYPHPTHLFSSTYKTDFRLLSKEEELEYCKITEVCPERVVASQMEVPPMLKKLLFRELSKKGIEPDVNMKFDVVPNEKHTHKSNKFYRFAEPAESTEIYTCELDIKKSPSPNLYKNIELSAEKL